MFEEAMKFKERHPFCVMPEDKEAKELVAYRLKSLNVILSFAPLGEVGLLEAVGDDDDDAFDGVDEEGTLDAGDVTDLFKWSQ